MSLLLSLQGCMAVGKTTAAKYIEAHVPEVFVDYENPAPLLAEIRRRGLEQNTQEGFIEIQRLFIRDEIQRYERSRRHPYVLYDLGAEEIEFYTLFYPASMGFDWHAELALKPELDALRRCEADHVLFLDADIPTLVSHKLSDATRNRGSFQHWVSHMLETKRAWFLSRAHTDFLAVGGMNKEQVGQAVSDWIGKFMVIIESGR